LARLVEVSIVKVVDMAPGYPISHDSAKPLCRQMICHAGHF